MTLMYGGTHVALAAHPRGTTEKLSWVPAWTMTTTPGLLAGVCLHSILLHADVFHFQVFDAQGIAIATKCNIAALQAIKVFLTDFTCLTEASQLNSSSLSQAEAHLHVLSECNKV